MKTSLLFTLVTAIATLAAGPAHAAQNAKLLDVGVLGLATHDLFSWNAASRQNVENGRLDLSTIFDFNEGKNWETGGNPKNGENAPVYTVTRSLVAFYRGQVDGLAMSRRFTPEAAARMARLATVAHFIGQVKASFERVSGLPFPTSGKNAAVTNEEQATLRAMHDLLPGKMTLKRGVGEVVVSVTDFKTAWTFLSPEELSQELKAFDGAYDAEYLSIALPNRQVMSLKDADRAFIEGNTDLQLDEMLRELSAKPFAQTSFAHHLREMYAKGICPTGNDWLPATTPCAE